MLQKFLHCMNSSSLFLRVDNYATKKVVIFLSLLCACAVSLFLRTRALNAGFWIDEGISVGIASFSWDEVPRALRLDGSPPLYYMLLHYWMKLFGSSEESVHFLSVVPSMLSIPAAFWAANTLFGRRSAWFVLPLVAVHPFLTYYAQEVRMYSLVVLLSFLALGCYGKVFLQQERRAIPVTVLIFTLLLYTHNWSFFFIFGCVCATVINIVKVFGIKKIKRLRRENLWHSVQLFRRVSSWPVPLCFGVFVALATFVLYLPWVPTMIFQARNTGAPWAARPGVTDFFGGWTRLLGGSASAPFVALLIFVGSVVGLRWRKTNAGAPGSPSAVATLLTISISGIFLGWLVAQLTGLWVERYLIVFLPVVTLLLASALAFLGRFGVFALCLLSLIWFNPLVKDLNSKSNARQIAEAIGYRPVHAGDAVISTQPEQVPVLRYYLGGKLSYYSSIGAMNEPRVMDWRQSLDRLKSVRPRAEVARLVRRSKPGRLILLVQPIIRTARWNAPWTALVRTRAIQWGHALDDHPRLRRIEALPQFGYGPLPRGVRVVIYSVRSRSRVTTRFL